MRECALTLILAIMACCAAASVRCAQGQEPPNPFGPRVPQRRDAVPGLITRSNGDAYAGRVYLTRDKRLELYSDGEKKWYKLKLKDLSSLTWKVEFERKEKEWRWKDSGSDVKVLTGRTKIDRKYKTVALRKDGKKIEGHVRGTVIYVQSSELKRKYFLYWNHPSEFGQKPEDLCYVMRIDLDAKHYPMPEKRSPLTRSQLSTTEPVFESLEKELKLLASKHDELKNLGKSRYKLESQEGLTLTLRTWEKGPGIRFRCARIAEGKEIEGESRAKVLKKLGLELFPEVLDGSTKMGDAARAALKGALKNAAAGLQKLESAKSKDPEK